MTDTLPVHQQRGNRKGGVSYHGSSIIGRCDGPEPLLTCCVPAGRSHCYTPALRGSLKISTQQNTWFQVHLLSKLTHGRWSREWHSPDLQFDFLSIQLDCSDFEVDSWKRNNGQLQAPDTNIFTAPETPKRHSNDHEQTQRALGLTPSYSLPNDRLRKAGLME